MSDEDDEGYGGFLGAFPYAYRTSESTLFRSYVVVGGLVALLVAVLFLLAVPVWVAGTLRAAASVTLSRAFLFVVWLAVFVPLVAPVLLVARRHRRGGADDGADALRYDLAMGAAGYLFVASGYLGLLASAPPGSRSEPAGVVAPVVTFLYGLPRVAGVVPPVVAALLIAAVHLLAR